MRKYRVNTLWDDPYNIYEVQERYYFFWWRTVKLYWRKDEAYNFMNRLIFSDCLGD